MLRIARLNFSYRKGDQVRLLRDLSLQLAPGRILVIIGPNGSGKTTLAKLIIGQLDCDEGSIENLFSPTVIRYQNFSKNLLPWYSAKYNLRLARASHLPKSNIKDWLELAGFGSWQSKVVRQLSGGQRQILSVILCLSLSPGLLILDEPFSAIDPKRLPIIWGRLREWTAVDSRSVIVITHNLDEAVAVADKILILPDSESGENSFMNVDRSKLGSSPLTSKAGTSLRKKLVEELYQPVHGHHNQAP